MSKYDKYPDGNDPNGASSKACYAYAVTQQDYDVNVRQDSFFYAIGAVYNGKDYSEDRNKYNDELEIIHIPASTYAIFVMPPNGEVGTFTGRIFREWLPSLGYQLTGSPELELSSSKTDAIVWLPIKNRLTATLG